MTIKDITPEPKSDALYCVYSKSTAEDRFVRSKHDFSRINVISVEGQEHFHWKQLALW